MTKIVARAVAAIALVCVVVALIPRTPDDRGHATAVETRRRPPEADALDKADRALDTTSRVGLGNVPMAQDLAKSFADRFLARRKVGFTEPDLDEAFPTYCKIKFRSEPVNTKELQARIGPVPATESFRPSAILFLTKVPHLRRFKEGVRRELIFLAWLVAGEIVANTGEDDLKIGVGLRGAMHYGASAIGQRSQAPDVQEGYSIDPSALYDFFALAP